MENRIKNQIKVSFEEIKKLKKERKSRYDFLHKSKSGEFGMSLLFYDFEINKRLYSITSLLKILLNNEKIWDVKIEDLGTKKIYLTWHDKKGDAIRLNGMDYRV